MPPGTTILPRASIVRPPPDSVPGQPSAAILSPCTPTSMAATPCGVTTCPPVMTRSSMAHLLGGPDPRHRPGAAVRVKSHDRGPRASRSAPSALGGPARTGVQQDMPYDHLEIEARWQRYWD